MKARFLARLTNTEPRIPDFIFKRSPWIMALILFFNVCAVGLAAEKRELTQYERRLKMLGQRYQSAPAGTVEFPQELMAVSYINEGFKLFEKNQYDLAREAALNALKFDPKSPVAHELLADVCYLKQEMVCARQHYRWAFEYEPAPRLKEKLQKLERESSVEKNLNSVEELHFLIQYDQNQSEYEGFELRMLLHTTYIDVSHDLAHYLNHKTTVLFYPANQFHQVGDLPHWVGGLFDGKVRLPVSARAIGERQLRAVARHEIAHVFIDDLSRKRAPIWLHEGFAVYEQNKVDFMPQVVVKTIFRKYKPIPFADLFHPAVFEHYKNDQKWMQLFYLESYSFIDYLISRYGVFKLKQFVLAFAADKNVDQGIYEVYKISLEKMEREWKASVLSTLH